MIEAWGILICALLLANMVVTGLVGHSVREKVRHLQLLTLIDRTRRNSIRGSDPRSTVTRTSQRVPPSGSSQVDRAMGMRGPANAPVHQPPHAVREGYRRSL